MDWDKILKVLRMGFNVEAFICVEIQELAFIKILKILIDSSIPHFLPSVNLGGILNIIRKKSSFYT